MDSLYKSSDRYQFVQMLKDNIGYSIVCIDIVNFKSINDKFGYYNGDVLLTQIIKHIRSLANDKLKLDVCRYESDIIMLMIQSQYEFNIIDIINKITKYKYMYEISFRVGYETIDTKRKLNNFLDSILYVIKDKKYMLENNIDINFDLSKDIEKYQAIKKAIMCNDSENFNLVYQPKISTRDKSINSCEVLSRWSHPVVGKSTPDEFLSIIKNLDKELEFDLMIFEKACMELSNQEVITKFSINTSVKSISNYRFIVELNKIIDKYNIQAKNVTLEILEDICDYDNVETSNNINKLISLGFSISIDDFGTGYSSYFRIAELKFSEIKIPKEFLSLESKESSSKNDKILSSIVNMCKKLNCKIVIEGVETEENIKIAEKFNIDYLQGYYYSKPVDKKEYIKFIQSYTAQAI